MQLIKKTRLLVFVLLLCLVLPGTSTVSARPGLTPEDHAFLNDLQRRLFTYFWEQADPATGIVPDRARTDGSALDENHRGVGSIAATGFGLTALCIGSERRWIDSAQAIERARNTLRFFADRAFQQRGWFYHWIDTTTGQRRWNSEVSSIDTALLLAGVLTVRQCFARDAEVVRLATKIYQRVDFRWMLNGDPLLLSHGWRPETGFLRPRWDTYSEDTILYLLAIGSARFGISPRSWRSLWKDRYRYAGYSYFTTIGVPLFMHQYSHAWVDYRGRRETSGDRVDYFENSVNATLAHREFCTHLSHAFPDYGPDVWGITASDSVKGYLAWGGPPRDPAIDGTVVPSAAGGSLMFTPDLSARALRFMRQKFGDRIYGRYGFVDAFNPNTGWVNPDVIAIDQGIILLSAENARTASVWRWFMQNGEIPRAMQRVGLVRYKTPDEPPLTPHQETANVRERVNTIIRETLRRGEFTVVGNVKAITRVPPSFEDVEEIKSYGDQAVLPLEEHFSSGNAFEYELAMRLMAALGGPRIIEPFRKLILHDQSARRREYALRWITQGPWDQASKVITQAAANDPDAGVRHLAQELLSGHKH